MIHPIELSCSSHDWCGECDRQHWCEDCYELSHHWGELVLVEAASLEEAVEATERSLRMGELDIGDSNALAHEESPLLEEEFPDGVPEGAIVYRAVDRRLVECRWTGGRTVPTGRKEMRLPPHTRPPQPPKRPKRPCVSCMAEGIERPGNNETPFGRLCDECAAIAYMVDGNDDIDGNDRGNRHGNDDSR
jgi:hypothetical protein